MENLYSFITTYYLFVGPILIVHAYLAIRFTVMAIQGDIDNYNFLKMAMVVFIPFIGYYFATKKEPEEL
jgi:NADH:ubiquinone oxidoreductase subunit 3 (subunit A)